MEAFYPKKYYAFGNLIQSTGFKNFLKILRKKIFDYGLWFFNYPEYYGWLEPLGMSKDKTIADIGCGNGQLVYEMWCSGYKNLSGFDPYLPKEISLQGLFLQKKDVTDVTGTYDYIMLHHSFEHMKSPLETMNKLSKLLNPRGKLLIRVPVTDAEVWEKEGINWFQLDAPRHFFIPSKKAMLILAERSGLKLSKVIFDSNENQFIITDMYRAGKSYKDIQSGEWARSGSKMKLRQKAQILNRKQKGDQACFYFEKA
jgi:SAM-dependent methyltransferase